MQDFVPRCRATLIVRCSFAMSRAPHKLKPIITLYSQGADSEAKKFEGFIEAAFWIGVDHTDKDLASVKVRQPSQSYDEEVSTLKEFTELLVKQQINFSVEFFSEPILSVGGAPAEETLSELREEDAQLVAPNGTEFQSEVEHLKEEYKRGSMSKKQYKSKKEDLLKQWRDRVEGRLET